MKRTLRRLLSSALAAGMIAGLCLTASAINYPSSYWPLHNRWADLENSSDLDGIVSNVQQTYDLLTQYPTDQDVCWNLEPKCAKASWACEVKGDIDGAITWLERQLVFARWLHDNGQGYEDTLLDGAARLEYLKAAKTPRVFAQTGQDPSPYASGPKSGTWYGAALGSSHTGQSAALMYITFNDGYSVDYWVNYYLDTESDFREAASGGVIEVAWNFSPESTAGAQAVLSADSYISEGVRSLGNLDATVLLRVGAEMNNWSECDPDTYIQAFRKVAQAAAPYDNIQMVFSPDNISNRNVTIDRFYPGDQYVDWVGMSTYQNTNYQDLYGAPHSYAMGSLPGSNPYYGTGVYDYDPLVVIKPIVDLAAAHNKPVMVSECGFSYRNPAGQDQTAYAVDQLTKFYSYVNMIYPQVKAVFYFDVNLGGSAHAYALDGNSAVASAYRSAISGNGAYLSDPGGSAVNWEELSQTRLSQAGTVKLAVYAPFPGVVNAKVEYYVDGALAHTSSQAPYYFELDTAALGGGSHTVHAVASGNQFSRASQTYTLTVPGAPVPAEPEPQPQPPAPGAFTDVAETDWYYAPVQWAVENGITSGMGDGSFGAAQTCTRAQIITFLHAASGKPEATGGNPFTDVAETDYFYNAARWAAEKGLIDGDRFAGGTPCTRSSTMVYLWKLAGAPEQPGDLGALFTDVAASDSHAHAVGWAVREGVTAGMGDGAFGVDNICTRAQIMTFLRAAMG